MKTLTFLSFLLASFPLISQSDTTEVFDYNAFGDAEGVKRYCTVKVLNQTPQRIVSLGYERMGGFDMGQIPNSPASMVLNDFQVRQVGSFKAQVNIPVWSTTKVIWQMGANYWGSRFQVENPGNNAFAKRLDEHTLQSFGLNTTIFKPLNERNFLIIQASLDANAMVHHAHDWNAKALTFSGTAIYGWKTSEKNMIGTGLARTFRAGRILHVPVLYWNKTFNDQWGMELLLPARGHLRYNFSTSSILQFGFELEGNQFWTKLSNTPNGEIYLQRGELKPRIQWDKKLTGFLWFNAQMGWRYNWRFDGMNERHGSKIEQQFFSGQLGNPLYFNFSLNFVSP